LGFAGEDFTECLTLALSIQDLDLKLMPLLIKINVVMLFPVHVWKWYSTSCSLTTILLQFEPDESWLCHPGIWTWCVFLHVKKWKATYTTYNNL